MRVMIFGDGDTALGNRRFCKHKEDRRRLFLVPSARKQMAAAAAKPVLNYVRSKFQQKEMVSTTLDDGSTVVCYAHLKNYRKSESGRPLISLAKNIVHLLKELVLSDERVLIATRQSNGTVLLSMLFVPSDGNVDLSATDLAQFDLSMHLDGDFHSGIDFQCPRLADVRLDEGEGGRYAFTVNGPTSALPGIVGGLLAGQRHFQFTVESPEARKWLSSAASEKA